MILARIVAVIFAAGLLVPDVTTAARASPDQDRAPIGNPLWVVSLKTLSATRERPIFSPSRRPTAPVIAHAASVAVPPVTRPVEPDRPLLSILGTVIGRTDQIAVFMEDANKNVLRLHTGQDYDGWVLRAVESRAARFEKDRHRATLSLSAHREERAASQIAAASQPSTTKQPPGRAGLPTEPGTIGQPASPSPAPLPRRRWE